jgi:hypothetical protein
MIRVAAGKSDDVLRQHLVWLLDYVVASTWNPNVVSVLVFWSGRLFSQCEPTNKHVGTASAITD